MFFCQILMQNFKHRKGEQPTQISVFHLILYYDAGGWRKWGGSLELDYWLTLEPINCVLLRFCTCIFLLRVPPPWPITIGPPLTFPFIRHFNPRHRFHSFRSNGYCVTRSPTSSVDLHRWSILLDPMAIMQSRVKYCTTDIRSRACEKISFLMLRVTHLG